MISSALAIEKGASEAPFRLWFQFCEHRKKSKVLMARSFCFQFMGELLPKDGDLMRRSWHSISRKFRSRWLFLDNARPDDRHLQRTNWETRNFVLWQLLSSGRTWCSKRENR
jgi:hypothetical protein